MEKDIKVSKSYSLRPDQIAWLRQQGLNESTADKTVSASAVLERIIDEAIAVSSPTKQKKSARALEIVAL
jgi:hypothetical protein